MSFWHAIGRQFRNPTGAGGRVMGRVMRIINRRPNRLAIDALDLQPGLTVLELGCGPGDALAMMHAREPTARLHGLDQSSVMLAQAARRNRTAVAKGRIELHKGDFLRLPFPDSSVDRVLGINIIYFWPDVGAALAEIGRVMRPYGRIALYATDATVMRRWKFAGPDTHRLFDKSGLESAFAAADMPRDTMRVIPVRGGPGVPGLLAVIGERPNPR